MISSALHSIARCGAPYRALRRIAAAALALGVLVSSGAARPEADSRAGKWHVVLAAGDDAERVFDNAARAMAQRLAEAGVPAGDIHRLSASAGELAGGAEPASADTLLRDIAELPARPGDRCLIFLTSHGERDAGVWLARSNRALSPDELARALSRGCAAVPTIVIVSACYSGSFASGKMEAPNRVILTAARRDRPSFGCQAHRTYNFFDECLLANLSQSATWHRVFDTTDRCIRRMEQALHARPSEPQAYFGRTAAALRVGF